MTLRSTLRSKAGHDSASRRTPEAEGETLNVHLNVEMIRVVAYVNFFIMIGVAVIIANVKMRDVLLAGPTQAAIDAGQQNCPPFDGAMGDRVEPNVLPGEGFDFVTQSHLNRAFGYNNICTTWDYSPSREIVAMVYPIFEYALLLYLFFDYIQAVVYFKKGWCSKAYFRTFSVLIVFMLIGCAWFRMIFVVIAYQKVAGHTAGFLCLQITLFVTAMMNTWFIIDTKQSFAWLGGRKGTMAVAIVYMLLDSVISCFKFYLTGAIVFQKAAAPISMDEIGSLYVGQVVDNLWTVCNAVVPLCVAMIRASSDNALYITIDLPAPNWTGEDAAGAGEVGEGGDLLAAKGDVKDVSAEKVENVVG